MNTGKIISVEEALQEATRIKHLKKPIVLAGGCFDILHIGHITFLSEAQKSGSLFVLLESDETVRRLKGESRPIFPQTDRARSLAALRCVDYVVILPPMKNDQDYSQLVSSLHPDAIAVTKNDQILEKKRSLAASLNARFSIIPFIPSLSTSQLAKILKLE
jgi:FAD synthetase